MKATLANGIKAIDKYGALLTFPINNKPEPHSIWAYLHPKTKMRWEWDEDMNFEVADLWHLREHLSRSHKVVYAKWYQHRATFFSKGLFPAWLFRIHQGAPDQLGISPMSRQLLAILEEDSPLSSKEIKKRAKKELGLTTKGIEKGLKELWSALLIVGFGEVDDGAFPSLAIGATSLMFESLWQKSLTLNAEKCDKVISNYPIAETKFYEHLHKICKKISPKDRALPSKLTYDQLVRFK